MKFSAKRVHAETCYKLAALMVLLELVQLWERL